MKKEWFNYKEYLLPLSLSVIVAFGLLFFPPRKVQWDAKAPIQNKNNNVYTQDNIIKNIQNIFSKEETQPTQPEQIPTQTVVLMGDMMLSRSIWAWNKKHWYDRVFNWYHPLTQIENCTKEDCLIFANLESPFSQRDLDKHERTMRFRSNTGNISVLTWLRDWMRDEPWQNTLIVSLANNHINNAWWEGVVTTTNLLNEYWIYHIWAWASKEEAEKILSFTKNDITWCIAWYSYDWNWWKYWGKPLHWNKVALSGMLADLEIMKIMDCDIKVMMPHRGAEYHLNPNKTQIEQAHALIDNGLDIIVGGHSHIPGKIEIYKGKYIFYSLGNALFDQDWWMSAGNQKWMDTIFDDELQKNTVPTYIAMIPELAVQKHAGSWDTETITIQLEKIYGARIKDGLYTGLDDKTLENLVEKITPKEWE